MTNAKPKILLIDDTSAFLLILNSILKENYETYIATSGTSGLDIAGKVLPDLVILDVMMPGLSGYDVLQAMKGDAALKNTPVILITGKTSPENEAKGYALGAAGYIKKPFEALQILSGVEAVLEGTRA